VGNAGDCRAILIATCDGDDAPVRAMALSHDHDCHSPSERIRVARRTTDPFPIRPGATDPSLRVAGALSVTRALGDAFLKRPEQSFGRFREHVPYIVATPEVRRHTLGPADRFVVLASDGVLRWMTNDELAGIVVSLDDGTDSSSLAQRLLDWILTHRVAPTTGRSVTELQALPPGPNRRRLHDDMTIVVVDVRAAHRPPRRHQSMITVPDHA
jgi:pyruvate dehydrogenase phosphatase